VISTTENSNKFPQKNQILKEKKSVEDRCGNTLGPTAHATLVNILKKYLNAKEELMETQIFFTMQRI
jgi:hypothetical protein